MTEAALEALEPDTTTVGRYVLHRQIARGGMATIHIARLMGDEGFSRIVAAKRLLPEFAEDSEFVAMFLDEARIASKCHHKNLVPVLDVVTTQDEVLLVQELVHGAPLHHLLNQVRQHQERVPVPIAVAIASQVLGGLHAVHEMSDEMGAKLDVVHRDVSPQNVMIATDGTARLLDFGVAKASMAAHTTREGTYKGKLAYSAPEQLHGKATRQSDIYSLSVLLWELIVGHRMHGQQSEAELVSAIMTGALPTITETLSREHEWDAIDDTAWKQLSAVEPIVRKGLAVDVQSRWATAADMEAALVAAIPPATTNEVAAWLKKYGKDYLEKHDRAIATEEASWRRKGYATSPGSRRTPVPSELRRVPTISDGSGKRSMPPAPQTRRGPYLLVAILAMLVGALTIVVFSMREDKTSSAATTPPQPATQPKEVTVDRGNLVEPPPVVAEPQPAAAPTETAKTDEAAADERKVDDAAARSATTTAPTRGPPKAIVRTPVRAPVRAPVKAPPPPTTPTASGKGSADCTPPYYYEGSKKIFKPACL